MANRPARTPALEEEMSRTTLRTRTAIIDAALEIWPAAPRASLNDIAERAGVGRSTLHRHFIDRDDLRISLGRHVRDLAVAAIDRADPSFGPPPAALRRIVDGLLDVGPGLVWLHEHVDIRNYPELRAELIEGLDELDQLLESARQPGDTSPPEWRSRIFWEVLRVGAKFVQDGATRQHAVEMILFTLTRGTFADDA
ncbi:TetR/AcrR family transcriptional regulator [Agromyces aerolatus]|uniref:TetR/AcrR family transcriptional regulator n=1 Tax=Agromyces sp. LY-1074 TaxID=3074080 RepID=UPI00286589EC|nr:MULTISPECIES: helix-turn-helix domain-containing protein [unclassified Agromyces]MDR5699458.1 helix-turn-helix domain-containing protein [Agromyces sp. LY-1074]MDR5705754.1 helix-turn-helix domain-containing protein [Agromyces sp. LY-1358]